jgi:hypothetical protein
VLIGQRGNLDAYRSALARDVAQGARARILARAPISMISHTLPWVKYLDQIRV